MLNNTNYFYIILWKEIYNQTNKKKSAIFIE